MIESMKNNRFTKYMVLVLALVMLLNGSYVLPSQAAEDTYSTNQTLDATADVAFCDGSNPNNVGSYGVTFMNMGAAVDEPTNNAIGCKDSILIAGAPSGEKTAYVVQFSKPIDATKVEYLTLGLFAGMNAEVRVYDSKTTNFIEDTAKDVFTFSTWGIEKKILPLTKYADKDGMVRNITFYLAEVDHDINFIIDYYQFTTYKKAKKDLVLKACVNTYYDSTNVAKSEVPTFQLSDEGMLKDLGWDNAVYIDGIDERIWKVGRYVSLEFDQVNTKYYEQIYIDFFTAAEVDFTLYAYSADELLFNEKNADQVVKMTGGETTTLVLDAANFADEDGYLSKINLLLAGHSGEEGTGFQAFFGDVTFRLPREYASVTIYTEKLSGGYQKSDLSTSIEGRPGDKVKISPYTAEELGLYGYVYNASAGNVLSGVLKEDKTVELKLYYSLKTFEVTINNDEEQTVIKKKYGSKLDLMEYRKENMLMNILVDGLETKDTTVTISEDTVIDITQTPGNYVFYMVDDELFATRTYTGEAGEAFAEPLVPIKEGFVGVWEEYALDGGDKTVHAVYTKSEIVDPNTTDNADIVINVANKMKEAVKQKDYTFVWIICAVALLLAALVALLVILVKKGKLGKKQLIATGVSVAVCAAAVAVVFVWSALKTSNTNNKVVTDTAADYKFEELFASSDANAIKPDETLTFKIDKELGDKNYIQIDVDTNVNLLGTIEYYNLDDKAQTNVEEFFLEGASEETFYQFLDNFRDNGSGRFKKHLTQITLTNVSEEDGSVTMNTVGISDRIIDYNKAELYVENDFLKVGMDLICGGALTYLESKPRDGAVLEEILTLDGDVQLGLNYGDKEGSTLLSESVNLINIYDKGREVQQSFYADVDEEHGYNRGNYVALNNQDWPYNPVQGGDQDDNSSQIIDFRVEDNLLYVKTRAMDWGQHNSTTKSYMENWYTLNDDMLFVKNRFIDWNGFENVTSAINSEMPAVYFAQAFDTFVTYDGIAPWTGAELDRQKGLGSWADADGSYTTENPSEGWFAWVNDDDYGIGMYVPGVRYYASGRSQETSAAAHGQNSDAGKSSMLAPYRPDKTSDYAQCYVSNTDYTAPVITTTMDAYVPLEYTYVIRVDTVENLRSGFQNMDLNKVIDNSGLNVWDD